MAIADEQAWFKEHREELLQTLKGRWVVVHQCQLVGDYPSFEEAYDKGIELTRCEEFLVRQVSESDETFNAPALTLGIIRAPVYL